MSLFTCSKCGSGHSRFRDRLTARPASYCAACHAKHMRELREIAAGRIELSRRLREAAHG